MSVKEKFLAVSERRIREIFKVEENEKFLPKKYILRFQRAGFMLYHEMIRDDVAIRAQSFSYLTLFSLLPILAGLFSLFGLMSQWGPVQDKFQEIIVQTLQPIPDEYRETFLEFLLTFKDQYIQQLHQKSATLGFLALGVLVWIAAKVFFNIEDLMNQVWSVRANRRWIERIQNFILSSVIVPTLIGVSLSLPSLLERWGGVRVGALIDHVLPAFMNFVVLSCMFRYFPNAKVAWRSAIAGAVFSSALFFVASILLQVYFRFGAVSAYGKIAALPIVAFFIYVVWVIFILGAEVSYLVQNRHMFSGRHMPKTTLAEARLILEMLEVFKTRFAAGGGPVSAVDFCVVLNIALAPIYKTLRFLQTRGIIVRSVGERESVEPTFVLAKDLEAVDRVELIKEYLCIDELVQSFDSLPIFREIFADLHQKSDPRPVSTKS